ncbi:MAG: ergothioneine biosynthesis protein EgtB [Leptospiraceae bacterium]|nr:ergothioneine biosynthesis protein EgtB [Leptospiraceae bacterium]MCP5496006.1 ergothioneine biosynthesis protein EgtB [Leptospiraceae bacterium]
MFNASYSSQEIIEKYKEIRQNTEKLCQPLEIEDYVIQTTVEASPAKWHLAHVTWFFETFLLSEFQDNYKEFDSSFRFLFNSYYEQVGNFFPRSQRGLLSRPTVKEVYKYRVYVDENILHLLQNYNKDQEEITRRILIGLNHEEQHQELLLTDLKYNLGFNPLLPSYRDDLKKQLTYPVPTIKWFEQKGCLHTIGYDGKGFSFDNESPKHKVYINPFRISSRLVTNGEYIEFIEDNAYKRAELWLSDAWSTIQKENWQCPLYWEKRENKWYYFTLGGSKTINLNEPVCHVSYYEADAFARWKDKRLPLETEWEFLASNLPIEGNFREKDFLQPIVSEDKEGILQMYGDVWEWTSSPYTAYPGYKPAQGALGEYNGKFMCNQFVLRGGSCVTPKDHVRPTYRNFFHPNERWQFMGFRLAEDL